MGVADDDKGIQLVVDLTMYSTDTRDNPSKQACDLNMSTSEHLATRRRSTRKEMPTAKALEAIVDAHSNSRLPKSSYVRNKRNKKR